MLAAIVRPQGVWLVVHDEPDDLDMKICSVWLTSFWKPTYLPSSGGGTDCRSTVKRSATM